MSFVFAQYKKEGDKEGEIVEPLCIVLPQMTDYVKYFENGGKTFLS